MELVKYSISSDICFEDAEKELLAQEGIVVEEGYPVVFMPGMKEYPHCEKLVQQLEKLVGLRFAFIKAQRTQPKKALGGFHVDVHWGSGIKRTGNGEVLRILLNAHSSPRIVHYLDDKDVLRKNGIVIFDNEYSVIHVPENIKPQVIDIPSRGKDYIWGLKFLASKIPHVGVTDERGLFVVGFGEYIQ